MKPRFNEFRVHRYWQYFRKAEYIRHLCLLIDNRVHDVPTELRCIGKRTGLKNNRRITSYAEDYPETINIFTWSAEIWGDCLK